MHTPNPLSRQFSVGKPFFPSGSYAFYSQQDAAQCPVAEQLLGLDYVAHVLITPLFLTVTLIDETLWTQHHDDLLAVITPFLNGPDPLITNPQEEKEPTPVSGDLMSAVEELIAKHAAPVVAEHGGHIQLKKIEDGVVYVELQGACDSCPSALITLKDGLENLLCFYIPSIKEVRATNLNI